MKSLVALVFLVSSLTVLADRVPANDIPFSTWKGYLEHAKGNFQDLFEDGQYLDNRWVKYEEVDVDGSQFPPSRIDIVPLTCRDRKLYPTHPQQFSKDYVMSLVSKYDRIRLPGTSSACTTPTTSKRTCIVAMRAVVAVMSDTYQDSCGNYYRGYWFLSYRVSTNRFKTEDNMGTLFSKGRTQYPKPHAQFAGEVVDGNTYPVSEKDFLFLTPLLPGDMKKIRDNQAYAIRAGFTKKGMIWNPRN